MPLTDAASVDTAWHPVHERLAEIVRPAAGEAIADLGCGSGGSLAALAARRAGVRLVGLDLDVDRLHGTASLATGAALARVDLSRSLPIATTSVDAVVCHNVIELLPDAAAFLGEVRRVLRPGGRAVLSHTDFCGLIVHGAQSALTDQILHAYAHVQQPWMSHIDAYAARRLPGLATHAGLVVEQIDGHVLASSGLDSRCRRLVEVADVVRGHARRGTVDLTTSDVDAWWEQLVDADRRGAFLFAETALITVARRTR